MPIQVRQDQSEEKAWVIFGGALETQAKGKIQKFAKRSGQ